MNDTFLFNYSLSLRPVEIEDADFIWEVESDSSQWIQNSLAAPLSRENILQYVLNYEADPFRSCQLRLILVNPENERLGILDLFEISAQHHTAKIGIYILPAFRNKGIGGSALSLLEKYARKVLNLRSICAEIIDSNLNSIRMFETSGYSHAGVLKNWILSGTSTFSLIIMQKDLLP